MVHSDWDLGRESDWKIGKVVVVVVGGLGGLRQPVQQLSYDCSALFCVVRSSE